MQSTNLKSRGVKPIVIRLRAQEASSQFKGPFVGRQKCAAVPTDFYVGFEGRALGVAEIIVQIFADQSDFVSTG